MHHSYCVLRIAYRVKKKKRYKRKKKREKNKSNNYYFLSKNTPLKFTLTKKVSSQDYSVERTAFSV